MKCYYTYISVYKCLNALKCFVNLILEVCTGRIFLGGSGPHGYNLGPARQVREIEIPAKSETKYKISAQFRPRYFFSDFGPYRLGLRDF